MKIKPGASINPFHSANFPIAIRDDASETHGELNTVRRCFGLDDSVAVPRFPLPRQAVRLIFLEWRDRPHGFDFDLAQTSYQPLG